jgi:Transglycosylase-like domain
MVLCVAALVAAAPASGHRLDAPGLVHEIDHAVKDANALRRDLGKPEFPVDLSYREGTDQAELAATLELWQTRFDKALKKSFWWRLALCESGGDWEMKGRYQGGFSFHRRTWAEYRGKWLPKFAYQATPAEQIRVARRVLADQGWDAWPACSRKLGLRDANSGG